MMKMKRLALLCILLLVGGCKGEEQMLPEEKIYDLKDELATENFIQNHLLEESGLMHTNITGRKEEYLSETIGLWMEYLLAKNDFVQFEEQVKALQSHFLTKEKLVIWELQGTKKAPANAFIDDLRIVNILYQAGEKWEYSAYTKLADQMSKALVHYQTQENLMVDYIEVKSKRQGSDVTISYIIPEGFNQMSAHGHLPAEVYMATKQLLLEAPYSASSLFPKVYHIPTAQYIYDEEVNMIDQFYVGYHRAQWNGDITELITFTKEVFQAGGNKLFGRYNGVSKAPVVSYESVAVYALAILMCLEVGENEFAKVLYTQMKTLQNNDDNSPYYGGYLDTFSKETHTFDNLLALIAERKGIDEGVF